MPPQDNSRASADKISITRKSYDGRSDGHRTWTVLVAINGEIDVERILTDPFTDTTKSGEGILLCDECSKDYFDKLVSQLGFEGAVSQSWPHRQISIHEELNNGINGDRNVTSEPSIYSLFWEVLENVHFWKPCVLTRVRLYRTWAFNTVETRFITRQPSLLSAQKAEYRILLVIARSFRRDMDGRYRDYRPSLVLGPLLKIALWCNQWGLLPRVHVDVVRPGTIGELELKLGRHRKRPYDIVHLDMHGKVVPNSSTVAKPYLRFAKHYNEKLRWFSASEDPVTMLMKHDDSLSDVKVVDVASLLQKYGITKVALSACFSSYAQHPDMLANMCHVFLSHGASHVSAMSFQVLESTAQIYYAAFYEALLVNGQSFLSAAAVGREALRTDPRQSVNALVPTNYHRVARVSTDHFWPKHRVRVVWLRLVCAYCLQLVVILSVASALLQPYSPTSWSRFPGGRLGSVLLASMVLYMSVRWVRLLQCPLWLWMLHPVKIFHPKENLRQLSGHVEIEHLVLEDRLEFEANRGAIYLWSGNRKAALGMMVTRLAPEWVRTGFVDSVDIIPATVFKFSLSSLQWWLRLWITHHKSDVTDGDDLGRRRLVVITDFDKFYDVYRQRSIPLGGWKICGAARTELQDALWRMTEFVSRYNVNLPESDTDEMSLAGTDSETDVQTHSQQRHHKAPYFTLDDEDSNDGAVIGKTNLIVTGSYSADQWRKVEWYPEFKPEILDNIGRAVPHLHDVRPSQ